MKSLIDLVNKSFIVSEELNDKLTKANEMKMHFVASLNDEQCIEFLKFYVEMEELQDLKVKAYINHTYNVCKEAFKLR